MKKGVKRIKKLYPLWFFISLIILCFVIKFQLQNYLIWVVMFLILKDIFIDLLMKKGPTPLWLEHAPFVMLISVIGLLGLFGISCFEGIVSNFTLIIAIIDSVIDFLDDVDLIKHF